jgi:hypothetical protein
MRSARSLADIGLVRSIPTPIPIPTPIAVPNESAGDTQAKNLFSLFLHHHLSGRLVSVRHAYSRGEHHLQHIAPFMHSIPMHSIRSPADSISQDFMF